MFAAEFKDSVQFYWREQAQRCLNKIVTYQNESHIVRHIAMITIYQDASECLASISADRRTQQDWRCLFFFEYESGLSSIKLSNWSHAISYFKKALEIFAQMPTNTLPQNEQSNLIWCYFLSGYAYQYIKNYEQAAYCYTCALKVAEISKQRNSYYYQLLSYIYDNLIIITPYLKQPQPEQLVNLYQFARETFIGSEYATYERFSDQFYIALDSATRGLQPDLLIPYINFMTLLTGENNATLPDNPLKAYLAETANQQAFIAQRQHLLEMKKIISLMSELSPLQPEEQTINVVTVTQETNYINQHENQENGSAAENRIFNIDSPIYEVGQKTTNSLLIYEMSDSTSIDSSHSSAPSSSEDCSIISQGAKEPPNSSSPLVRNVSTPIVSPSKFFAASSACEQEREPTKSQKQQRFIAS